jgi:hypothetical protein
MDHPSKNMTNNAPDEVKNDWRIICTVFMVMATGAVLYGGLPSLIRTYENHEYRLEDFFHILIWAYGLLGVSLCHIEDAFFKKNLARIGFTWTAFSLLWALIRDLVPRHDAEITYPFDSNGNTLCLLACFITWGLLIIYDIKKLNAQSKITTIIKWSAHFLIAAWIFIPIVILGLLNIR